MEVIIADFDCFLNGTFDVPAALYVLDNTAIGILVPTPGALIVVALSTFLPFVADALIVETLLSLVRPLHVLTLCLGFPHLLQV